MSCMIEDTIMTRIKPLAGVGIVVASVACLAWGFVLFSQSHTAAHQSPRLTTIAPPAMPVMPVQAAVAAPTPIATTAIPSTVLRSERIASLRVFGVTVFRYVTRIEGPRK
jgi:hypothetical protein